MYCIHLDTRPWECIFCDENFVSFGHGRLHAFDAHSQMANPVHIAEKSKRTTRSVKKPEKSATSTTRSTRAYNTLKTINNSYGPAEFAQILIHNPNTMVKDVESELSLMRGFREFDRVMKVHGKDGLFDTSIVKGMLQ